MGSRMTDVPEDFAGFMAFMADATRAELRCGHALEFAAPPTEEELRRAIQEHLRICDRPPR